MLTSNERLRRNVKAQMRRAKLSQRRLARLSAGTLTQAAISYFLAGENQSVTLDTLDIFAMLLKVPAWELLT